MKVVDYRAVSPLKVGRMSRNLFWTNYACSRVIFGAQITDVIYVYACVQ